MLNRIHPHRFGLSGFSHGPEWLYYQRVSHDSALLRLFREVTGSSRDSFAIDFHVVTGGSLAGGEIRDGIRRRETEWPKENSACVTIGVSLSTIETPSEEDFRLAYANLLRNGANSLASYYERKSLPLDFAAIRMDMDSVLEAYLRLTLPIPNTPSYSKGSW